MAGKGRSHGNAVLILALASGASVQAAAKRAKLGERTVYRRLSEPAFREEVGCTRSDMLTRAVGQFAQANTEAVRTLRRSLRAASANVRVRAARAIVELTPRLRDATDLAERVAALEAQIAAIESRA